MALGCEATSGPSKNYMIIGEVANDNRTQSKQRKLLLNLKKKVAYFGVANDD
jgi:hypothetical protein